MYLESLLRDGRYGLRMLWKSPLFTCAAVLSLAFGIGINSAAFSVAEAAWLKSWPARDPDRVGKVVAKTPQGVDESFSYAEYRDIKNQSHLFEGILAYSTHAMILRTGDEVRLIVDEVVSRNYFDVLGFNVLLGSSFMSGIGSSKERAVVISDDLWHRVFHADPTLIGKQVVLTNKSYTVIGIAPPHFRGLERGVPTEAWVTAETEDSAEDLGNRRFRDFELLGRLRQGASFAAAQAELNVVSERLADAYPIYEKARTATVISDRQRLRQEALPSVLLMSVVGLVLLISSANVAGLLVARSQTRQHEIAIRMSLGAARSRLTRQLLTESFLLGLSGAVLGILLARWFLGLQPFFMPPSEVQLAFDLRLDKWAILFTVIVSVGAVLIFGLVPALQASKINLIPALKASDAIPGDSRRLFLRSGLVIVEVAVSVVLLTASGLLLRSFIHSSRIPLGFDSRKSLLFFDLNPNVAHYDDEESVQYFQHVAENVRSIPGVKAVTFARRVLLSDFGGGAVLHVAVPGVELPQGQANIPIEFDAVAPGYFETVGTRIVEGRDFTAGDGPKAPGVVVISSNMALHLWYGQDPVGHHISVEGKDDQVIGVVEDAKINDIHESNVPYMYVPFAQMPTGEGTLIVATAGNPRVWSGIIHSAISEVDKNVPLRIRTMDSLLRAAFWTDRMAANLVGALSLLGMFLASVGLYGVIAFLVSRRKREIGIRMALGANRLSILRLVLGQGLKLSVMGIAIGVAAGAAVTQLMAGMLYGVRPRDPVSFGCGALAALLVSIAATSIPALRAISVNPLASLRCE